MAEPSPITQAPSMTLAHPTPILLSEDRKLVRSSGNFIFAHSGIRGIAASCVVLYHCSLVLKGRHIGILDGFYRHSYLFVDLFFILSGYIIATKYLQGLMTSPTLSRTVDFLFLRLSRIYPAYAFWALVAALFWAVTAIYYGRGSEISLSYALSITMHLTMLQSLIYSPILFNTPLWSVAVEIFAYALLPLVAIPMARLPRAGTAVLAAFFGISTLLLTSHGSINDIDGPVSAWRCFSGFSAGVALSQFEPALQRVPSIILNAFQAVSLVLSFVFIWVGWEALAIFSFVALVIATAENRGVVVALLAAPPFQKLGEWSYSLYLCHAIVLGAWILILGKLGLILKQDMIHNWPVLTLTVFLTSVAVAALSWRLVEARSLAWLRGRRPYRVSWN